MKLSDLKNGQRASICSISLSKQRKQRLFYFGIYEGNEIIRIQASPFLDPVLYWVNATQLVLRNQEASCIEVEVRP